MISVDAVYKSRIIFTEFTSRILAVDVLYDAVLRSRYSLPSGGTWDGLETLKENRMENNNFFI